MSQIPPSFPPFGGQPPAPTGPGWHPDPAGRHEYRYWDGAQWTENVADGALESVDPLTSGPASPIPPHQGPYVGGPSTPQPLPASGSQAPGPGPAPGLLIALVVGAAAVAIGLAVLLTRDDDGETTTTTTSTESTETTSDVDTTTTSDATSEDASESAIVDQLAAGIRASAGGDITDEQAECVAQEFLDVLGLERMAELGQAGGDPFAGLTSDEQTAVVSSLLLCVDSETLADIGANPEA